MLLKPVMVSLLLPPFAFVLVAAIGLLLLRKRPRLGKAVAWSALLCLTLCAMPVVADLMSRTLQADFSLLPPPSDPPGAIIVLGGDVSRSGDDVVGAHVGPLSLERLRVAVILARKTHLPILVSGGLVQLDRPPVAALMAETLDQEFKTPAVWIEDKSRSTWENASASAAILRAKGIKSVYVVTHAWHMRRALIAFAHTGVTVTAAPVSPLGPFEFVLTGFIPGVANWEYSYYALHEWIGCVWYALRDVFTTVDSAWLPPVNHEDPGPGRVTAS
jgi:uncharacterized SAM-binding protein YcdF (DUF218 family)